MAQGKLRLLFLWHMHQPFYKDLVSGEYRLPWVRLHALKDYYGMVKLLEEFPQVHQNFNIVPSLVAQLEDYNSGIFKDPFWDVAAKPASELTLDERHFALTYFFQAHGERMIGRYPRYRRLWEQVRAAGPDPTKAAITFSDRDYRDLQVLSQIAWFDEYYLEDPAVRQLIEKGQGYSDEDQRFIMSKQHEILKACFRPIAMRLRAVPSSYRPRRTTIPFFRWSATPMQAASQFLDCLCQASASCVPMTRRSRFDAPSTRTSAPSVCVPWGCGRVKARFPMKP